VGESSSATPPVLGIDFSTFVLSLSTSALMHLGAIPSPEGPLETPPEIALALAKQTIDILGMLEAKTDGNLTGDEERLLDEVLADLRLRYVAATKR
jgi:hypothetical protein